MTNLKVLFIALATFLGTGLFAQMESHPMQISIETDLAAIGLGGFGVWGSVQKHKHRMSISYVNIPNRYRGIYNDTGIKDHDQFLRLSLWRYWNSKYRFFYGINGEYHWRKLTENGNSEKLSEDDIQIGTIVGYHWRPFQKKENNLKKLSFSAWAGVNFRLLSMREARVFELTGSVYELPSVFEPTGGINVIYTF